MTLLFLMLASLKRALSSSSSLPATSGACRPPLRPDETPLALLLSRCARARGGTNCELSVRFRSTLPLESGRSHASPILFDDFLPRLWTRWRRSRSNLRGRPSMKLHLDEGKSPRNIEETYIWCVIIFFLSYLVTVTFTKN